MIEPIERKAVLESGQVVYFRAGGRTPYWTVSFERGDTPSCLKGVYTDFDRALTALETYVSLRQKNKTTVKEIQK